MTDKPTTHLLSTAMLIYQVKGEDATRLWYDSLTEEQQVQLQNELADTIEEVTASFREIAKIIQGQIQSITSAFRHFAEALESINK